MTHTRPFAALVLALVAVGIPLALAALVIRELVFQTVCHGVHIAPKLVQLCQMWGLR